MSGPAHPRMVTLVREAKGWSQAELAAAAGISQGFVSKVEAGLLDLSGDKLEAVADALSCPVALLVDPTPVQGLEVTCLHHRRRHSKMSAATKRQIEAVTHLTRVSVQGLMRGIEFIPGAALEALDIDEYGDPAEIARVLRTRWRVPSGPIRDMTALLEAVGVIIVQRALGSTAQDAVSMWPHDPSQHPLMVVNEGVPTDRYRFSVAHELGHLVMHRLPGEGQEAEADAFASAFLAPGDEIEPDLIGLTVRDFPRLLQLKARWGLSVAALVRRAKDLGVISDRQYREFQIQLGRLGWRTIEPGTLAPERPATLEKVIAVHRDGDGYTDQDLAHVAVMLTPQFRRHYLPPARPSGPRTTLRAVPQ